MNRSKKQRVRVAGSLLGVSAVLFGVAACGSSSDEGAETGEEVTVRMALDPGVYIPAFIAEDRGMFDGVDVEVENIGYAPSVPQLLTGQIDIACVGPLEAASYVAQGEPLKYMSTVGGVQMYNGIAIRAEDAEEYATVEDLAGKKLGIPGVGTGTWQTFRAFSEGVLGIGDPQEYFDVVTADSGALLALLERGEIDGALLFFAETMGAERSDKFESLFTFTGLAQEELGQPLPTNGIVGNSEWLEENPEAAEAVVEGMDEAVQWVIDNPEAFEDGGEYAHLAEGDQRNTSEYLAAEIPKRISEGAWYMRAEDYTDDWRAAMYELIEAGEGTLVETVPAAEELWWTP